MFWQLAIRSFNVWQHEMFALLCYWLIDNSTWKKLQNWPTAPLSAIFFFFANKICTYHNKIGLQFFALNFFEPILGLDSGNSFSKTNSKNYRNVGVPENEKKLQTRNIRTISHKVRLNWVMKLTISGNTSLIETIKW